MSTTIEWTQRPGTKGETWNPVVGCTKVSAGCKHCYAETVHDRRHKAYREGKLQHVPQYAKPFRQVQLMHDRLVLPLNWKQPRTVFVNSMSDLFHADVPFTFIDQVFAVMALTPQHTYQVLTKRPERMAEYFSTRDQFAAIPPTPLQAFGADFVAVGPAAIKHCQHPLPNVWLGTSVEDQKAADERIPQLMRCPAVVRFLSCEPLLGPVDLTRILYEGVCVIDSLRGTHGFPLPHAPVEVKGGAIHWVIAGGESGSGARPMHPDWVRSLRDQCKAAGVPFFFKQWGAFYPGGHPELHTIHERGVGLAPNGALQLHRPYAKGSVFMQQVNKHASGRLLDGVCHNEFPSQP